MSGRSALPIAFCTKRGFATLDFTCRGSRDCTNRGQILALLAHRRTFESSHDNRHQPASAKVGRRRIVQPAPFPHLELLDVFVVDPAQPRMWILQHHHIANGGFPILGSGRSGRNSNSTPVGHDGNNTAVSARRVFDQSATLRLAVGTPLRARVMEVKGLRLQCRSHKR